MGRRKPTLRTGEERDELVLQWRYLPAFVAKRLSRRLRTAGVSFGDAEGEGLLALIRSAELYDPDRGVRFVTYATNAIRRRILKAVGNANLVHVPRYPGKYAAAAARARGVVPLDEAIGLAQPERETPDSDELRKLRCNLRRLPSREREVLVLRSDGLTLKEVGERLGVTRERIRQLEKRAMKKLRVMMGVAA